MKTMAKKELNCDERVMGFLSAFFDAWAAHQYMVETAAKNIYHYLLNLKNEFRSLPKPKPRKKPAKSKCRVCGMVIWKFQRFKDLPCYNYCCMCCPHRDQSPCPNEQKFGTPTEQMLRLQAGVKNNE